MGKIALKVNDVIIRFNLSKEKVDNFKELLIKKKQGAQKEQLLQSQIYSLTHL